MGGRGATSLTASMAMVGMGIDEAMHNTNPDYNKGLEYQLNCQRCVYAYEMNRRGEDCVAKPRILNGTDDYMSEWPKTMVGQTWNCVGSKSKNKVVTNIESTMKSYGDGSRAIVFVTWKKGTTGHVFNVENVKGKIRYVDGQSGRERDIVKTIAKAKPTRTFISRVDNLTPNQVLLDKAIKRR